MIGRVAGAPVIITPSWAIAAVLLTVLFAPTVEAYQPDLGGGIYVVAFAFVVLLFGSVMLHEVAHAVVARKLGHRVTELALTVWGGHTAYTGTSARPRDSFLVAVVGPLTNLLLAAGFWLLFDARIGGEIVPLLFYAAAFSNAFVGFFNLLPGLPLDGGQVLESAVWAATGSRYRGAVAAAWTGRAVAVGLLVVVLLLPLARGGLPDWYTVLWAVLIGTFLWSGAGASLRAARRREAVTRVEARALVRPASVVPTDASAADVARAAAAAGAWAVVVVEPSGRPVAVVEAPTLASVPPERLAATPVAAVAVGLPGGGWVELGARGEDLVDRVAALARAAAVLPVVDAGRVVGVLLVNDVVQAVQRARPGGGPPQGRSGRG
ncbi:peptidase M50 [Paraoerskovia sediminicola]|uniref:Zinc metalloprotease n=1 Tax=Paraoerskovia sediminicola TaxID=1138587 RepID=A0ABN6XFG7_9CELL|nr:peptidase M50 [Paraoerskovia sediminicola]